MWWFLLLCWIARVVSQEDCLAACSLPVSTCTYVNYPVFPVGLNVTKNEELAGTLRSTVNALPIIQNDDVCKNALYGFSCGVLYPKCNNQTKQKIKPCVSQCKYVRESACALYIFNLGSLPYEYQQMINCSRTDDDGTPFFFDDTGVADAAEQGLCYALYNLTSIPRCGNFSAPNVTNQQPGGCQTYDPELSPNTSTVCAPFISKEIYVDIDIPGVQREIDLRAANLTSFLELTYRMLPVGCYKKAMSLVCQTAYPTCSRATDPNTLVTYEVPNYPCYETCAEVLEECSYILSLIGPEYQNIIDCGTARDDGTPQWPHGPSFTFRPVPRGNATVSSSCATSVFPLDAIVPFVLPDFERCPVIMGRKPNPKDKDFQCWVPCPDPTYSDKEWQDLVTVSLFFASISFVCMFFLLATTLLDAQRRAFRLHMPIYFSGLMMAIAFFINGTDPRNTVWCDDPVTYSTARSNTSCAVQGFFFHFFGLSAIMWWVVIGYHMFSSVYLNHSPELKKREKFYHLFAWGIPLVLAVITLSINAYSFAPPAPWCYIHDPNYINDYNSNYKDFAGISFDYYVFYIPIGISLVLTLTFLGLVFYKVFKVLRLAKSLRKAGNDARVQFRIVFFLVVLLILFFLIFEWRISLQISDPNDMKEVDLAWAICKIKIDVGFPDTGECPGDTFPRRVSYNYTAFETSLAASFGFWIFVTFGTDVSIFIFWRKLLRRRTWKQLKFFVIHGDKEMSSSSLHRSSSTVPMREKSSKNSKTEGQSGLSTSASEIELKQSSSEVSSGV